MQQFVPLISTALLGLFGTFGIEADEQTVLALVNGLVVVAISAMTIWKTNRS